VVHDKSLDAIPEGDGSALQVTNAERGFGFERPAGPVLFEAKPLFVLWASPTQGSTLRLTRFESEVILPEFWWEDVSRGYFAFLAHSNVRMLVEPDPALPYVFRLQPVNPLSPGSYVLHDGDLLRARQRDEVGAFFPFRIERTHQDTDPWAAFGAAQGCLREIEQAFLDAHQAEAVTQTARFDTKSFSSNHAARLRHCAGRVQASLLAADDPVHRQRCRLVLLTLWSFAHALPWEHVKQLRQAFEHTNPLAPLLFEWAELQALQEAVEGRRAVLRGELQEAALHARRLSMLYADQWAADLPEGRLESLERLLWLPFFIDPEWSASRDVAERLFASVEVFEAAFVAIAAHRVQRLQRLADFYPQPSSQTQVAALVRGLSPELLGLAEGISPERAGDRRLYLSPTFSDSAATPDPKLEEAVGEWIRSRRKALLKCLDEYGRRKAMNAQGLFLVRIQMSTGFFGPNTKVLAEPLRLFDGVAPSFGDEPLFRCVQEHALSDASKLNVGTEASFVLAVGYNGDPGDTSVYR
jgi:hypothetical protein